MENANRGTWNHETGGVGAHKRSDGTVHSVTAASKTESERQQVKKSTAEVILCKGAHTRHIERPSDDYGKEEGFGCHQTSHYLFYEGKKS
jgi:hypothetical protein